VADRARICAVRRWADRVATIWLKPAGGEDTAVELGAAAAVRRSVGAGRGANPERAGGAWSAGPRARTFCARRRPEDARWPTSWGHDQQLRGDRPGVGPDLGSGLSNLAKADRGGRGGVWRWPGGFELMNLLRLRGSSPTTPQIGGLPHPAGAVSAAAGPIYRPCRATSGLRPHQGTGLLDRQACCRAAQCADLGAGETSPPRRTSWTPRSAEFVAPMTDKRARSRCGSPRLAANRGPRR